MGLDREAGRQEAEERTCSYLLAGCSVSDDLALAPRLCSGRGSGLQLLSTLPECVLLPLSRAAAKAMPSPAAGLPRPSSVASSSHWSEDATLLRGPVPALQDPLLSSRPDNKYSFFPHPRGDTGNFSIWLPSQVCFTNSLYSIPSVTITRTHSDFLNWTQFTYLVTVCPINIIFHVCHDSEKVLEAPFPPPPQAQEKQPVDNTEFIHRYTCPRK